MKNQHEIQFKWTWRQNCSQCYILLYIGVYLNVPCGMNVELALHWCPLSQFHPCLMSHSSMQRRHPLPVFPEWTAVIGDSGCEGRSGVNSIVSHHLRRPLSVDGKHPISKKERESEKTMDVVDLKAGVFVCVSMYVHTFAVSVCSGMSSRSGRSCGAWAQLECLGSS